MFRLCHYSLVHLRGAGLCVDQQTQIDLPLSFIHSLVGTPLALGCTTYTCEHLELSSACYFVI